MEELLQFKKRKKKDEVLVRFWCDKKIQKKFSKMVKEKELVQKDVFKTFMEYFIETHSEEKE